MQSGMSSPQPAVGMVGRPGERARLVEALGHAEFAIRVRGYERGAVDRYVEEVNRLLAEVKLTAGYGNSVRHELDEVNDELLQRAHDAAAEINLRARAEAQECVARARAEAEQTLSAARAQADELLGAAQTDAAELRAGALRDAHELRQHAAQEADAMRAAARREADETTLTAATRVEELSADLDQLCRERARLLDDVRGLGEQLQVIGDAALRR